MIILYSTIQEIFLIVDGTDEYEECYHICQQVRLSNKLDNSFLNVLSLLLEVSFMSFSFVLLLISLPVLAVCAFAMYMGMSGLEKKKEKRVMIEMRARSLTIASHKNLYES